MKNTSSQVFFTRAVVLETRTVAQHASDTSALTCTVRTALMLARRWAAIFGLGFRHQSQVETFDQTLEITRRSWLFWTQSVCDDDHWLFWRPTQPCSLCQAQPHHTVETVEGKVSLHLVWPKKCSAPSNGVRRLPVSAVIDPVGR